MTEIVSMGVHILDVLGRHVSEIPPGQGISLIDEIRITAAGTSAGTSVDLAKLGCSVTAVGAIGNDEMGNILIGILNRYGVNTKYLARKDGVQTSGSILPIRPNGERPALHVMGSNAVFSFEDVPLEVVAKADFVHIGGFYLMPKFDGPDTVKALHWNCAETLAPDIIRKVLKEGIPPNILVNINFPNCKPEDVKGTSVSVQGQRQQDLLRIDERFDGRGNPYYWIAFARGKSVPGHGTDLEAIADHRVSVTPLRLDLTDEPTLTRYAQIF